VPGKWARAGGVFGDEIGGRCIGYAGPASYVRGKVLTPTNSEIRTVVRRGANHQNPRQQAGRGASDTQFEASKSTQKEHNARLAPDRKTDTSPADGKTSQDAAARKLLTLVY